MLKWRILCSGEMIQGFFREQMKFKGMSLDVSSWGMGMEREGIQEK